MLSWWKCAHCDLFNNANNKHCQACFNEAELSPLQQIMHEQNLLFDGFMRMKILKNISQPFSKLIARDVIKLCHKFSILVIDLLIKNTLARLKQYASNWWLELDEHKKEAEMYIIEELIDKLINNHEYFLATKMINALINFSPFSKHLGSISHYNYGINFKMMGEYKLALKQFESAIEINPSDPDFYIKAASCYRRLNDNINAKENYLKAIEMNENDAKYHSYYGNFVSTDLKDFDTAKSHFDRAIELDPNNWETYADYGRMYRNGTGGNKDYKMAEKYYLKSLEINQGKDDTTNASFAYMLYLMGDMERAKKYIDIQLEIDERHGNEYIWSWFHNGLIVKEKRDESLLRAVQCVVTNASYRYTIKRLQEL